VRIVVVNDGTGYGHNVIGLSLATGEYIAVVNNDCRLDDATSTTSAYRRP